MPLLLALLFACAPEAPLAPEAAERDQLEDGLEVVFAPLEDTISVELEEIARVVDGRLADPDAPAEDYRIQYAVYNLRNVAVYTALADARDAGVQVQVLVDADQLDPDRDWNLADEYLQDRGFSYAEDHRDLSDDALASTELIGIDGSGLMHLKTRLFVTPERRTLVTGSMNPGDNAVFNDETLHLVEDERLVDAYLAAVDAVLHDEDPVNAWDDAATVNVLFSPEASGPVAGTRLLEWLAEEEEQILLAVYSVRDITAPGVEGSLVDILGERVAAGVPVYLVTDRKQSDAWGDTTEDALREVGVHVYEVTNETNEFTAMHSKVAVLGRTSPRVITDAANWSKSGLGSSDGPASNVESTLFIERGHADGRTGRRYLAWWLGLLARYADQAPADGEPSYDTVAADLLAEEGWPTQPVRFVAEEAETSWGETIRVVGDLPELGAWGQTGLGVPLDTDAETYPTWAAEPVELPLGVTFAWKLVAEQEGALRWEGGDDRATHAAPPPFTDDGVLEVRATWR